MAGLGAYMLAGALDGAGKGIERNSEALRQQAIEQLRQDREDRRTAEDRAFRSQEATREMQYRSSEAEKERKWRSDEAIRDNERMMSRDMSEVTGEDGTVYLRRGSKAEPVTGPDGKPIKARDRVSGDSAGSGMSQTEWRRAYENGMKAGAPGDDVVGADATHDWGTTIAEWKAQGLSTSDPRLIERVEYDLRKQAKKQGLKGADAEAWVDEQMAEIGIGEGAAGTTSVGRATSGGEGARNDIAPAKGDLPGSGQETVTQIPQTGSTYTRQNPAKPTTQADFQALPPGAVYVNPADGKLYEKR